MLPIGVTECEWIRDKYYNEVWTINKSKGNKETVDNDWPALKFLSSKMSRKYIDNSTIVLLNKSV